MMLGSIQYGSAFYIAALAVLLGFAAWRDVATRTIPDRVSIALIAVGAVLRLSQGLPSLVASLLVAVVIFALLLPLCSFGYLGGADLKLVAALSVGLSPQASLHLLLAITVIGGVLAALYLLLGRWLRHAGAARPLVGRPTSLVGRIVSIEFWRIRRSAPLPYGLAIAIGATVVVLQQGV